MKTFYPVSVVYIHVAVLHISHTHTKLIRAESVRDSFGNQEVRTDPFNIFVG